MSYSYVAPEVNKIMCLQLARIIQYFQSIRGHWLPSQYLDSTAVKVAQKKKRRTYFRQNK